MAEYIDREALLSAAHKLDSNTGVAVLYIEYVLDFIRDFPVADVAPVRHGRWSSNYCTVCGLSWDANMCLNADDDGYFDPMPDYCPNCGARMDGGGEDD